MEEEGWMSEEGVNYDRYNVIKRGRRADGIDLCVVLNRSEKRVEIAGQEPGKCKS